MNMGNQWRPTDIKLDLANELREVHWFSWSITPYTSCLFGHNFIQNWSFEIFYKGLSTHLNEEETTKQVSELLKAQPKVVRPP